MQAPSIPAWLDLDFANTRRPPSAAANSREKIGGGTFGLYRVGFPRRHRLPSEGRHINDAPWLKNWPDVAYTPRRLDKPLAINPQFVTV